MESNRKMRQTVRSFAFLMHKIVVKCFASCLRCFCCCCEQKKACVLHSDRKTIHSLKKFRGGFLFISTSLFLPCLLINSITYVEQRRKENALTHTHTHLFMWRFVHYFSQCNIIIVLSHFHMRNYELCVDFCGVYTMLANYIHILRTNSLCNSVNALFVCSLIYHIGTILVFKISSLSPSLIPCEMIRIK